MPGTADHLANDTQMRLRAFEHVQRLTEIQGQLTAKLLSAGFHFDGTRIPLINPQRGIFKPRQMRFLLSIKTVVPRRGGKVWYDDQREAHRQIYQGEETVDYAFMGTEPAVHAGRGDPVQRQRAEGRKQAPSQDPACTFLRRRFETVEPRLHWTSAEVLERRDRSALRPLGSCCGLQGEALAAHFIDAHQHRRSESDPAGAVLALSAIHEAPVNRRRLQSIGLAPYRNHPGARALRPRQAVGQAQVGHLNPAAPKRLETNPLPLMPTPVITRRQNVHVGSTAWPNKCRSI